MVLDLNVWISVVELYFVLKKMSSLCNKVSILYSNNIVYILYKGPNNKAYYNRELWDCKRCSNMDLLRKYKKHRMFLSLTSETESVV